MDETAALAALAALARQARLDAFRLLVRHEPAGLPAGEVARRLGAPQNTLSAHLAVLSRAGLVVARRRGRCVVYRADLDRLRALTLFLVHDCCAGGPPPGGPLPEVLAPDCD